MNAISHSRILSYWAAKNPEKPAITHNNQTLSRRDLERRSNRLARQYQALGVRANDYVTLSLPNGVEFVEAVFAIWKLGATPQPVSHRLPDIERVKIIELAQPSLVVGVPATEAGGVKTLPSGYQPDLALSDAPLPEQTARY